MRVARPMGARHEARIGTLVHHDRLDDEVDVDVPLGCLGVGHGALDQLATGSRGAGREGQDVPSASSTLLPRTRSATSASCAARMRGDLPANLNLSLRVMHDYLLAPSCRRVAVEGAGRGELAQLVADHVLGDEHRDELLAVVHREVTPTISGRIVERRDQVLMTFLEPVPSPSPRRRRPSSKGGGRRTDPS
jgi:hypothetical protein